MVTNTIVQTTPLVPIDYLKEIQIEDEYRHSEPQPEYYPTSTSHAFYIFSSQLQAIFSIKAGC